MDTQRKLTLTARWDNQLVPAGKSCQRGLLIEITAPPKPEPQNARPPINLALVIDRSGSMNGAAIAAARRAAIGIAQGLGEGDRLSVVTFDSTIETLFSGLAMDAQGQQRAELLISKVQARGTTDLAGGWFEGARCAAQIVEAHGFAEGHVLVLSDGHANRGICDPNELIRHARELAERGIKTSAVGIGNRYSPLQLDALAEGGRGRLHDAETTEDIIDVVLGELGELHAITARDVRLTIRHPVCARLDLLARASIDGDVGRHVVHLGDIVADATRPVAVRVELPQLEQGEKLPFHVAASWKQAPDSQDYLTVEHTTSLSVVPSQQAEANPPDIEVVEEIADLWEARLAYQAMRHNERGDFLAAHSVYADADADYACLVSELSSSALRMDRLDAAQRRVSREWKGRSKREAFSMSKKAMLRERDLRSRDRGDWHDHLEE